MGFVVVMILAPRTSAEFASALAMALSSVGRSKRRQAGERLAVIRVAGSNREAVASLGAVAGRCRGRSGEVKTRASPPLWKRRCGGRERLGALMTQGTIGLMTSRAESAQVLLLMSTISLALAHTWRVRQSTVQAVTMSVSSIGMKLYLYS